jgi:hypothetical protein
MVTNLGFQLQQTSTVTSCIGSVAAGQMRLALHCGHAAPPAGALPLRWGERPQPGWAPPTQPRLHASRAGKVTDKMLGIAWSMRHLFVLTGGCEALAQLLLMAGAAHLPGALLPLLMQVCDRRP